MPVTEAPPVTDPAAESPTPRLWYPEVRAVLGLGPRNRLPGPLLLLNRV